MVNGKVYKRRNIIHTLYKRTLYAAPKNTVFAQGDRPLLSAGAKQGCLTVLGGTTEETWTLVQIPSGK